MRVISDNMAGSFMRQGLVDAVIVGADRIAANGDVANKIGTYTVAVLARQHDIPFYVAAPLSTFDLSIPDGSHIPIEQRTPTEVTHIGGTRIVPEGVAVFNPAFDVTPNEFVTAIMTEVGVARPPYTESLAKLARSGVKANPPMLVLGIESSCDETAAAIVEDGQRILSNVIHSQVKTHTPYGGVVPELASREHLEKISGDRGPGLVRCRVRRWTTWTASLQRPGRG